MAHKSSKKIVAIGGGTGLFPVLLGLKNHFESPTAIITMADDGGSAGILRDEFEMLPPGDVRRALIALSHSEHKILAELIGYRFKEGTGLAGHSFGNLFLAALTRLTGSFEKAIEEASKVLKVQGSVIPVTTDLSRLIAELEDGTIVKGETNIDIPRDHNRAKIKKVWLEPKSKANPRALKAITEADLVIIGPGDLYTSLVPNLLVEGVSKALAATKGKVMYISNCMTKSGETNGFTASMFLKTISAYLPKNTIDYVAINTTKPSSTRLKPYARENSWLVEINEKNFGSAPAPLYADLLLNKGLMRYDPEKLATLIKLLV
ncbi:MAG: YvcK family protein [bacterium]|nr:YvcK family protein [bacterium]